MAGTSSARFKAPWKLANLELPMSQDPSGVMLDMQYEDGEGDETYKTAFFYLNRRHDSWMGSIYSTNEYITAIASFITNSLVVLVFIRVLGYRRLPNQMMVNMALCQCLTATAYFVHSSLLITISKQAGSVCERSYKILSISWVLTWACMSCAVVERTLALNMPNFYQITIEFIGPVLVATPWLYAMLLVVLAEFFLFQASSALMASSCRLRSRRCRP
ncbi:uncharacterized protein LOC131952548 [Physella acuta]|uniref:uncharacterized protein LOC131952548 n=1 Tax=Physella acuta TaxID=109671 RepID=UPI0027DAC1BF|nr:uncharacterized protein LOC131952548 [Physella acuta]